MTSLNTVQQAISQDENVIVFISSQNCSICHVDEPRVQALSQQLDLPYYHLDVFDEPALASVFEVLTVPAVLVFHKGREWFRQARFIDYKELEQRLTELKNPAESIDYDELFKEA